MRDVALPVAPSLGRALRGLARSARARAPHRVGAGRPRGDRRGAAGPRRPGGRRARRCSRLSSTRRPFGAPRDRPTARRSSFRPRRACSSEVRRARASCAPRSSTATWAERARLRREQRRERTSRASAAARLGSATGTCHEGAAEDDMITLSMSAPGKNALSTGLMTWIIDRLGEARGEPVLLTGEGDAFSAGLNLKEVASLDAEGMTRFLGTLERMVGALFHYPGPLVAWINGHAIAGGCIVALACDHRLMTASPKARIGLNEVPLGLRFPPKTWRLVRHRVPAHSIERVVLEGGPVRAGDRAAPRARRRGGRRRGGGARLRGAASRRAAPRPTRRRSESLRDGVLDVGPGRGESTSARTSCPRGSRRSSRRAWRPCFRDRRDPAEFHLCVQSTSSASRVLCRHCSAWSAQRTTRTPCARSVVSDAPLVRAIDLPGQRRVAALLHEDVDAPAARDDVRACPTPRKPVGDRLGVRRVRGRVAGLGRLHRGHVLDGLELHVHAAS